MREVYIRRPNKRNRFSCFQLEFRLDIYHKRKIWFIYVWSPRWRQKFKGTQFWNLSTFLRSDHLQRVFILISNITWGDKNIESIMKNAAILKLCEKKLSPFSYSSFKQKSIHQSYFSLIVLLFMHDAIAVY
jgi:hypothetical protein